MGAPINVDPLSTTIVTRDGQASAELCEEGRGVRVHYGDALVLEVRPDRGRLVLCVPDGDLELRADRGAVCIHGEAIEQTAKTLSATAAEMTWRVGTWRLDANQVRERAETIVTNVHESIQTHAKQVRTVARGMFQVLSERTSMRSKDNTAIDGKRILLG